MSFSQLKHALLTPHGNNFFEFNLRAFNLHSDELFGKLILDVGASDLCVFGRHASLLGAKVVAIDPHYKYAKASDEGNMFSTIFYPISVGADEVDIPVKDLDPLSMNVAAIVQSLPFADNSFDLVCSYACVPEYLPIVDYLVSLQEMLRVTKPGGSIRLAPAGAEDNDYPLSDYSILHGFADFLANKFMVALSMLDATVEFHMYDIPEDDQFDKRGVIITKPI